LTSEDETPGAAPALPEQRVGIAMRNARELHGISLRQMAGRLGYHSHTALSSYERGAIMPTDKAVMGYEQQFGLPPGTLGKILEDARIERHGDAWPKRRLHIPADPPPEPRLPVANKDAEGLGSTPERYRLRVRRIVITGAAAAVVLVAVAVAVLVYGRSPAAATVPDGSDPTVTGCVHGAAVADSVRVYDPPEHLAGVLQLRASARCGTSWGRFVPASALQTAPPLTLDIDVFRPADGAVSRFHVAYDGLDAYGNMLISRYQCVYATITLMRAGDGKLAAVQTRCSRSAGQ
jgi:transcriptional regulator with XRE-family HTH domain